MINYNNLPHKEENDDYAPDSFYNYLNIDIVITRGKDNELKYVKVKKRAVDVEGNPIFKKKQIQYCIPDCKK